VLEIRDLLVEAGGRRLLQLDNLTLPAGQFVALLGPNGAGKSSLLKAISGELGCRGELLFHGQSLRHWNPQERARHVAVLPQASSLTFPFSAREVVEMGLMPLSLSRQAGADVVRAAMIDADCLHLAARSFPGLSGGEKQRVHLARVLVQLVQAEKTPLLLLDEPVSAQDLGQQHNILRLAVRLAQQRGITVLAVLHDLNQVLRYGMRCLVLAEGELVTDGEPEAVLTPHRIEEVWGYRPERYTTEERFALL